MTDITAQLREQQKAAMKAKDKPRLNALRSMLSEVKQREIDGQHALSEQEVIAALTKMVKQRRDSVEQYTAAGREDLAATEQAEIAVIEEFLPQPLSAAEVDALIDDALSKTGASQMADMGKVMGMLKPQVQGRADMGAVSAKIKARLA